MVALIIVSSSEIEINRKTDEHDRTNVDVIFHMVGTIGM